MAIYNGGLSVKQVTKTSELTNDSGFLTSLPTHTHGEATLAWGGGNLTDSFSPIDGGIVPELGANRLAFGNASAITVTYSRDGGNTWTDYGASNDNKVNLFTPIGSEFRIGKADSNNTPTANYLLRITIDTSDYPIYTVLNKFMIYCSVSGSYDCYCTIDASLEVTPTTFVTFANKVPINGWSGYNIINTEGIITYGNSPNNQYGILRFTFGCAGTIASYPGLHIYKIFGFGGVGWNTPSYFAKYGTIYRIGSGQSVTFPSSVTANGGFIGSLTGTASNNLPLSGGALTGPLLVNATNIAGNYDEGIRINQAKNGFSTLTMGGPANSTLGTTDGQWCFSCNPSLYGRILYIAHNGSITSKTYFSTDSENQVSPAFYCGGGVHGAVWNDLADSIPLGKGDTVEPGYCYCFDGEHYTKTSEYMQSSYIGIHSDTYGFRMGYEEGKEKLDVAVSGFVLAYVDKEYPVGTPLTCTKDGYLTEISKKDKIEYPEMVIAKYWKSEPNEEWGSDDKKVKVNGRKWVKIK